MFHRPSRRMSVFVWILAVLSLGVVSLLAMSWIVSESVSPFSDGSPAESSVAPSSLGHDDGVIPDFEAVGLDSDAPAVARVNPELLAALREASVAASLDDQTIEVTSGWRSVAYQEELFAEAVVTYGSEAAAREFVAPPAQSKHVTGDAVDIGPLDAQLWLIEHGADYGLCQTYANERWHFELATSPGGLCPEMSLDATGDWS